MVRLFLAMQVREMTELAHSLLWELHPGHLRLISALSAHRGRSGLGCGPFPPAARITDRWRAFTVSPLPCVIRSERAAAYIHDLPTLSPSPPLFCRTLDSQLLSIERKCNHTQESHAIYTTYYSTRHSSSLLDSNATF